MAESQQQLEEQGSESPAPGRGKLLAGGIFPALRGAMRSRRVLLPFGGAVLVLLGVLGYSALFGPEEFDPLKLRTARAALEAGDLLTARTLATELHAIGSLTPEQRFEVTFLLGEALSKSAAEDVDESRVKFAQLAASHLQDAAESGLPQQQETWGKFLLGQSLFYAGEIERAIPPLTEIKDREDAPQPETYRLLAQAWLTRFAPDPAAALTYSDLALGDSGGVDTDQYDQLLLQRAEILLVLNRPDDARRVVTPLTARTEPSPAQFLLGRAALADGRALRQTGNAANQASADAAFREALRLFELAEGRDTLRRRRVSGLSYLKGVCLLELNEPEYALVELDEALRRDPHADEAIAAGILSAEILQAQNQARQSVDRWRAVLLAAAAKQPFRNPWLSEQELRARLEQAVRNFWATSTFDEASLLLRNDLHFMPREESEILLAETYERQAEALLRLAESQEDDEAAATILEARLANQRAGHVYTRIAKLRAASRKYPDDLWASALAYLRAEDALNSIRVLEQYIRNEAVTERTAEALYYLAKSHLQLGEPNPAFRIASECVDEFPNHPIRYQARIIASQAAKEQDDLAAAEAPLLQNLDFDLLTPQSAEWRESLFELGKLYYLERKWDEAEHRLTEAVRRYPTHSGSWEARYLLAETLRQQAERDRSRSAAAAVESQRVGAARSALARLEEAVTHVEGTLAGLSEAARRDELQPLDQALFRNASFLRAGLLADLLRHQEAAQAYMEFINRYYGQPESLDAYVAVSGVFRQLDQPIEAKTALAQAMETLAAIPIDVSLANTSVGTRTNWQTLLEWLQSL